MILVLSGTEEGKEIVRRLHDEGINLLTTVATEYGKKDVRATGTGGSLSARSFGYKWVFPFDKGKGVDTVVDATHPYAIEVSQNAMDA